MKTWNSGKAELERNSFLARRYQQELAILKPLQVIRNIFTAIGIVSEISTNMGLASAAAYAHGPGAYSNQQ